MEGEFSLGQVDPWQLGILAGISIVAAIVSGMSGIGGGVLVSIFVTPIIGVRALVPTLSIAMLIAHVTRAWVYRHDIEWRPTILAATAAAPTAVLGSAFYAQLSGPSTGILIGLFLILTIPLRRIASRTSFQLGPFGLTAAAAAYGFVSGATLGGGMLIIPVLMATGLFGTRLIATDAVIGLAVLVAKAGAFARFQLLTPQLLLVGLLIGGCMIPGTYLARWLMLRTGVKLHTALMEAVVVAGGLSFLWRAFMQAGVS